MRKPNIHVVFVFLIVAAAGLLMLGRQVVRSQATQQKRVIYTAAASTVEARMTREAAATHEPTSVLVPAASAASTDSGWDSYRQSTLQGIIDKRLPDVEDAPHGLTLFRPDQNKFLVEVTYLGMSRPILVEHVALLNASMTNFPPARPDVFRALYQQEILVSEGDTQYWMPVQTQVLNWMDGRVKENQVVTFYILYLGTNAFSRPLDWVFWITDIDVDSVNRLSG